MKSIASVRQERLLADTKSNISRMLTFGVIALLYGVLITAPWMTSTAALARTAFGKLIWSSLYGVTGAAFGQMYGSRFVELASSRHFARAASMVIACLFVSSVVFSAAYCVSLVAIGDFGRSTGIFGSFDPKTIIQKLAGSMILFIVLILNQMRSIIFGGFIIGYIVALLFDRDWRAE